MYDGMAGMGVEMIHLVLGRFPVALLGIGADRFWGHQLSTTAHPGQLQWAGG